MAVLRERRVGGFALGVADAGILGVLVEVFRVGVADPRFVRALGVSCFARTRDAPKKAPKLEAFHHTCPDNIGQRDLEIP